MFLKALKINKMLEFFVETMFYGIMKMEKS